MVLQSTTSQVGGDGVLLSARSGISDRTASKDRGPMHLGNPQDPGSLGNSGSGGSSSSRGPKRDPSSAEEDEAEADFRSLRREAKAHSALSAAGSRNLGGTLTGRRPSQSTMNASQNIEKGGINVEPCYFDYKAAYKNQQSAVDTGASESPVMASSGQEAAMVTFLKSHGLSGPLSAYAKALALQGITDSSMLVTLDDDRLKRVMAGMQLDCTDELLLMDALRMFR